MRSRLIAGAVVAAAIVALAFGCASENSLVGGTCITTHTACGQRCVDLASDPENCGACSAPCPSSIPCIVGVCGGPLDGSSDGASGDGSTRDGAPGDGSTGDGSNVDACPPPPYDTAAHCGACGNTCVAPNQVCRLVNDVFTCRPPCTAPLVECEGTCIDVMGDDPLNCGACAKMCPSNICLTGVCQGATPGDVVLIGHDYRFAFANTSQAKLLTNGVFIPTSNPLRILSYEQFAEPPSVARAKSIIQQGANGRTVKYTVSNNGTALQANDLSSKFDVVLIYDQAAAGAATLGPLGAASAASLDTFARAGGVVIVLDGAAGAGEMPSFTTNTGLLSLWSHTSIAAGTRVQIVAPGDTVGSLVVSPYATFNRSVTFQSNEPNGGNVVFVAQELVDGLPADPVVIHKVMP